MNVRAEKRQNFLNLNIFWHIKYTFFPTGTWIAPPLFPIWTCCALCNNFEQCKLLRVYLPNAIDCDYFRIEWVMLVSFPLAFNITSTCTQEPLPLRSRNMSGHSTIFTGTSYHQMWSDLVLCGLRAVRKLCSVSDLTEPIDYGID